MVSSGDDLHDFNWIDKGEIKTARRKLKSLPYQGPRWYSKQATQWLLMRGVITWNDVKLGLTATAHLPPDTFQEPLDEIENIMSPEFAKKAINSLLGIWTVDSHHSYVVATQHDNHAMSHGGKVMTREAPGGMYDIIYQQETMTNKSMRPIVHHILDR